MGRPISGGLCLFLPARPWRRMPPTQVGEISLATRSVWEHGVVGNPSFTLISYRSQTFHTLQFFTISSKGHQFFKHNKGHTGSDRQGYRSVLSEMGMGLGVHHADLSIS